MSAPPPVQYNILTPPPPSVTVYPPPITVLLLCIPDCRSYRDSHCLYNNTLTPLSSSFKWPQTANLFITTQIMRLNHRLKIPGLYEPEIYCIRCYFYLLPISHGWLCVHTVPLFIWTPCYPPAHSVLTTHKASPRYPLAHSVFTTHKASPNYGLISFFFSLFVISFF